MEKLTTEDKLWGVTCGLLLGAGVGGHALRLVTLEGGIGPRHLVAGFACLLYGTAGALTWAEKKSGLWVSILGPVGGVTAVLLAPGASIDTFQIVLGIPQAVATLLAIWLLVLLHRSKKAQEPRSSFGGPLNPITCSACSWSGVMDDAWTPEGCRCPSCGEPI